MGTAVILAYHGELYITPDKQVGKRMASEMVMGSAPRSRDCGGWLLGVRATAGRRDADGLFEQAAGGRRRSAAGST